jgi:hypothetical protein
MTVNLASAVRVSKIPLHQQAKALTTPSSRIKGARLRTNASSSPPSLPNPTPTQPMAAPNSGMAAATALNSDSDPVKEFMKKLDVHRISLAIHAAEDDVQSVLGIVNELANQALNSHKQHNELDDNYLKLFMNDIVGQVDKTKVAADNHMTENIVHRVLKGIIDETARLLWKPSIASIASEISSRGKRIDNLLDEVRRLIIPLTENGASSVPGAAEPPMEVPMICTTNIVWPVSQPNHVCMLLRAFNDFFANGQDYGEGGVVLSKHDMQSLRHGVLQLKNKMCIQATTLVNSLPEEDREEYEQEEWYLGPQRNIEVGVDQEDTSESGSSRVYFPLQPRL